VRARMRAHTRAHAVCSSVQPEGKTRCVLAAATDAPACSCPHEESAQTLTERRAGEGTPVRGFVTIEISSLHGRGRRHDGLESL